MGPSFSIILTATKPPAAASVTTIAATIPAMTFLTSELPDPIGRPNTRPESDKSPAGQSSFALLRREPESWRDLIPYVQTASEDP